VLNSLASAIGHLNFTPADNILQKTAAAADIHFMWPNLSMENRKLLKLTLTGHSIEWAFTNC